MSDSEPYQGMNGMSATGSDHLSHGTSDHDLNGMTGDQEPSSMTSIVHIRASEAFPKKHHKPDDPSLSVPFPLLSAEYVEHSGKTTDGIIILSNYRLFMNTKLSFFSIALGLIDQIECRDIFLMYISCKDARTIRCNFANNEHCQEWYKRLLAATAPPKKLDDVFAFAQHAWHSEEPKDELRQSFATETSTTIFRADVERMKFDLKIAWRISEKNKDYSLCSTYPQQILVPRCILDDELVDVGTFRSSQRIPAVVWRHQGNGSVIARCSQPEVGWLGWRNNNDESLLRAIPVSCAMNGSNLVHENGDAGIFGHTSPQSSDSGADDSRNSLRKLLIIDARSYTAALANRAKGGGCEWQENYPNIEIQFMSLANIHSIRRSFQSVRALCATPADQLNWFPNLEATRWLQHISGLLRSAMIMVNALDREARPVLVHCSDGWDRTPQLVTLAELMLDPYYRTFYGFQVLVEKEWLEFGHKFSDRCGHGMQVDDANERCPVFLQWLDCVYQLHRQFTVCFEFNSSFLVKLAQHVYSCLFGTFMCNSSQERQKHHVQTRTYSVWAFLQNDDKQYRNYLYKKEAVEILHPACQVRDLELWSAVYRPKSEAAEDVGVYIESSIPSSSASSEDGDNVEQIAKEIAEVGINGCGGGPLIKTRSYADLLAAAAELPAGRQRRRSDPSVMDGLRVVADGVTNGSNVLDDESEEDDEIGNSKMGNGQSENVKFGNGSECSGSNGPLVNGAAEDDDEDSIDETLAEREFPERRMSNDCDDDTEPTVSETPCPQAAIESSTDTLVGDLTPDTKVPVASDLENPLRGASEDSALGQRSEGAVNGHASAHENGFNVAPDNGMNASTSTSEISNSYLGCSIDGCSVHCMNLCLAYQQLEHQPLSGIKAPVHQRMALNGFEHLTNGHCLRCANLDYRKCVCPNGSSGTNGHRRTVDIETLKHLNSCGRPSSTISTSPHSRTPSSGFPATPSDERSSDVTVQRSISSIARKLDLDGLPLINVREQQRLHEIIMNHQEKIRRLEHQMLMTRLALYEQVCQKCNGHSRRTTEHSDEACSLPDSLGNVEQHSMGQDSTAASDISWEQVDEQETRPTLWVPDHAVNRCSRCDNEFCMVRRKHHCRSCGNIFCAECSNQMIPIPNEQLYDPVRVCATCFEDLQYQQVPTVDCHTVKTVVNPAFASN